MPWLRLTLSQFKAPWLLTFLHTSLSALGTFVMLKLGYFELSTLGRREHLILAAFSVLFTSNIAMSNLSLYVLRGHLRCALANQNRSLVSLAFFQIIRNTVPLFTVGIYRVWFSRVYAKATYISLIPIVVGAGMCTVGDYNFTAIGLLVSITGVILAAVKVRTPAMNACDR